MKVTITGRSTVFYKKTLDISAEDYASYVVHEKLRAEWLRDHCDTDDVIDEHFENEDWSITDEHGKPLP